MPAGLLLSITQSKKAFFDRAAVTRGIDKTTARAFTKIGALGRRIERNMIRISKNPSLPGRPPNAHGSDSLLKEKIFFVYDASRKSVVIGPALINGGLSKPPSATVPEVLEFGGTIVFEASTFIDQSSSTGRFRRRVRERVLRQMKPRPYAGPTMEILETRYQKMWADDWRGGRV